MLDGKFLCTLTAIVIAVFAICNFENKKKNNLVENFMGLVPGGKIKPSAVMANVMGNMSVPSGNTSALMNPSTAQNTNSLIQRLTGGTASVTNVQGMKENYHMKQQYNQHHNQQHNQHGNIHNEHYNKQPFGFQVPPNMQKMLSPRGSADSFGLGTNIRYNKPAFDKMAYTNPEQYGSMVQENYGSKEIGCGVGGAPYQAAPVPPPSGYTNGDFGSLVNSLPKLPGSNNNKTLMNSLPIPTMESVGAGGDEEDVVNYNRMIFQILTVELVDKEIQLEEIFK